MIVGIIFGAIALAALVIAICVDYQAGACSSYIHRDGTIREWDRFGNVTTLRPDGTIEKYWPKPGKGVAT